MQERQPNAMREAHPVKILLAGASGYIGLHILQDSLKAGHQVTALVRVPAKLGPFLGRPLLKTIEIDLENTPSLESALDGHDVCIHAALAGSDPASELEMRDLAVAAKFFEAAGRAKLTRCIYLSSVAVHRPFTGAMQEEDALTTTVFYGATKAAGELFLHASCARHSMTGIVVRPGPVVGPPAFPEGAFGSHNRLPEMVNAAMANQPIEVLRGDGRQFIDVTSLAKFIRLLY